MSKIKLTAYSHGAGCGCKIAPDVLESILLDSESGDLFPNLLVGNQDKDDAAALDLGDGRALISTADFFMPIVDDPFDFGRVAATNAISDVYAMGGRPCLAISILGWPLEKLPPEIAGDVLKGARHVCASVDIPLAGGHSIDCPEPVFGLAVNGLVEKRHIKTNGKATPGDLLFLSKPLGVGILTTAEKRNMLRPEDKGKALEVMTAMNRCGFELGQIDAVHAMTDVTGFGLLGHALEMANASRAQVQIDFAKTPMFTGLDYYIDLECWPGGTERNLKSYSAFIQGLNERSEKVLADPQTSGGLLIAAAAEAVDAIRAVDGLADLQPIGAVVEGSGVSIV